MVKCSNDTIKVYGDLLVMMQNNPSLSSMLFTATTNTNFWIWMLWFP